MWIRQNNTIINLDKVKEIYLGKSEIIFYYSNNTAITLLKTEDIVFYERDMDIIAAIEKQKGKKIVSRNQNSHNQKKKTIWNDVFHYIYR